MLTKSDSEALRDAEDAVLQAQSRVRELGRFAADPHVKSVINTTAHQLGEVFGRLRDHVTSMKKK